MSWLRVLFRNAVTKKDLQTLLRLWRPGLLVIGSVSILGIFAAGFLLTQATGASDAPERFGSQLLGSLGIVQLLLIVLITPAWYAAGINGERRRQTWDLLLLSRLPSFAIVWGKLVAGLTFNMLLLIAVLPLLGIALLFGGVSLADIVRVYCVFVATIFLMAGIGLLTATLVRSLAASMMLSGGLGMTLAFGLSALILDVGDTSQLSVGSYTVSPQLTRLAPLDPLAGLMSAIPDPGAVAAFGRLGLTQQHIILAGTVPVWAAYSGLALALSLLTLALAAALTRHPHGVRPLRQSIKASRPEL